MARKPWELTPVELDRAHQSYNAFDRAGHDRHIATAAGQKAYDIGKAEGRREAIAVASDWYLLEPQAFKDKYGFWAGWSNVALEAWLAQQEGTVDLDKLIASTKKGLSSTSLRSVHASQRPARVVPLW